MKSSKTPIAVGIAVALSAAAYLGATAYINSKVGAQISALRDGEMSQVSQGVFGASDVQVSSGFFSRSGTFNLIVTPPGQAPFSVPVSFDIQQYPSFLSPVRADFTMGKPVSGPLHDAMTALGSEQFMRGQYSQGWGGANDLSMQINPLRGTYQNVGVDWGGGTVNVSAQTGMGESRWDSTSHLDAVTLSQPGGGNRVKIGAMTITYAIDANTAKHSGDQSYDLDIAPSDFTSGSKTQYAMREAHMRIGTAWNLTAAQDAGVRLKSADLSVSMQQPAGDVRLHADGFVPVTQQEFESMQSDPGSALSLLDRLVANANLSVPKALVAAMPSVQAVVGTYGTADGRKHSLQRQLPVRAPAGRRQAGVLIGRGGPGAAL